MVALIARWQTLELLLKFHYMVLIYVSLLLQKIKTRGF